MLEASYANDESDEFVRPFGFTDSKGKKRVVRDGDGLFFSISGLIEPDKSVSFFG